MIIASLLGVTLGLMLVGFVSHTPLRHAVQVLPAVLAMLFMARGTAWAPAAALPVFAVWSLIMLFIWLFLLGLARVITGTFAPAEIALTVVIGLSAVTGLLVSGRALRRTPRWSSIAAAAAFAALQAGVIWLSPRPGFATS